MSDLQERLREARRELIALADEASEGSDYDEARRLRAKAAGIGVALDFTRSYS